MFAILRPHQGLCSNKTETLQLSTTRFDGIRATWEFPGALERWSVLDDTDFNLEALASTTTAYTVKSGRYFMVIHRHYNPLCQR